MTIDDSMGDEIFIVSKDGKQTGPFKASVHGDKVSIRDQTVVVEEGDHILRTLPNGKAEEHLALQVDFHKDPFNARGPDSLTHYVIRTRKSTSLVPTPAATTINIANSQGIQIGNGNMQNVVGSLQYLAEAIGSAQAPAEHKSQAIGALRTFLSHPLVNTILGVAGTALTNKL